MGVILFAKQAVLIFSGKEFVDAILTTKILAFRIILAPVNSLFALNLFIPLNMEKRSIIAMSAAAFADFVINLFLIPAISQDGAAIGTIVAEIVELLIMMFFLKGIISRRKVADYFIRYAVVSLVILIIYFLILSFNQGLYFTMISVMMLSILAYFSILYFIKDEMVLLGISKIRGYANKLFG